ncbi:MAG: HAMP domain-containing protein [Caldilinea sp. CFX5]|nr:HAMP domain-containing protein [Caldilinea sp. CFX5]
MERFANLRWRLTLLFAVILLCTLLVTGFGVVIFVQQTEVAAWRGRQSDATRSTVRMVANLVENTRNSLNFISLVGLADITADRRFLDRFLRQYPILEEIVYLNGQGETIAATSDATLLTQRDADIRQTSWFVAAQAGRRYYSGLLRAEDDEPYLIAAAPAPNASVVAARVNLATLWDLMDELRFGESGLTYIVDRQGKLIAHPNRYLASASMTWPTRPPWFSLLNPREIWYGAYVGAEQRSVLGAVVLVPGIDWLVVTELTTAEAYANSRRAALILGGTMIAFMILMLWAGAEWLEGLILLPVERLRDGAIRIGQGDLTHRIEFVRQDEIGQVAVAFNQMAAELATLYDDLEQKIMERTTQLEEQAAELARSNAELAQFAYVASHDLQEPLRMVTNYLELLERHYDKALDQEAREFIAVAVDGATRMQQLIRDLLTYSRLGTRQDVRRPVALQRILAQVLDNLQMAIQESGAVITADPLPTLTVDPTQMGQLLQNLLTNAIKFRRTQPPVIHISSRHDRQRHEWHFAVADNGIGIDAEAFDRIFLIFQRLHTRREYSGTGIGLAICKKIVDRHGGRLWVESVVGQGSTFHFTIPETNQITGARSVVLPATQGQRM